MSPFLSNIHWSGSTKKTWLPSPLAQEMSISIASNLLVFVGENGMGKSTLLSAIAQACGFNAKGGSQHHFFGDAIENPLAEDIRLSWKQRMHQGFYLRAESFGDFRNYLDELSQEDPGIYGNYGGRSLNERSHGEASSELFFEHFKQGIYVLDEPEAGLSPQRQLALACKLKKLSDTGQAQFIIATHSPIIMSMQGAQLFELTPEGLEAKSYTQTQHFELMRNFMQAPERFHAKL